MKTLDVAFVRIDGKNFVLVPVQSHVGASPEPPRWVFGGRVRDLAAAAGLVGEVVPVWDDGDGGLFAFARPSVLPYLSGLSWNRACDLVNVRLLVGPGRVEPRVERRDVGQVVEVLAS